MTLPVYFEERLVGTITEAGSDVSFSYEHSWRRSKTAFPVSVTLPMSDVPARNALSWFWNLLPEEEQLRTLGKLLHHAPTDIYGLLADIGRETAGALSIGTPEGSGSYRTLSDDELAASLNALPERPFLADEPDMTMSLAGAQSKLTVAIFNREIVLPLNGAASTHIIKPASPRLYASVENEAFCMTLARAVGIETAPIAIGKAGDVTYLLVERYDRTVHRKTRTVRRHHQEDAAQALGLPPTKKYEARGGASAADLAGLIDRYSVQKAKDRIALLDRLIFSVAIDNTDAHAKNYSFFVEHDGCRLAPAYDLLTSLIYPNITKNLAMKIDGKSRAAHIQRRHWTRFAKATGYAPASTAARAARLAGLIAEKAPSVEEGLARNPFANKTALRTIRTEVEASARRVAANAQSDSQLDRQI